MNDFNRSVLSLSTLVLATSVLVACGDDPSLLDAAEFSPSSIPLDLSPDGATYERTPQNAASQFAWVTLTWQGATGDAAVNLDLHVVDPNGEEINLTNTVGRHGEFLENRECISYDCSGDEVAPRETIFWKLTDLPPGEYRAWVENISDRSGSFDIEIVFGNIRDEGSGSVAPGDRSQEWTWTVDENDCMQQLSQLGVQFHQTAISEGSCRVDDGVMISSPFNGITYRVDYARSTTRFRTSCETALSLVRFNNSMTSQGVSEVYHDGSFRCRNIAGTNTPSTHGQARAMDFRGFKINGQDHVVLDHWNDGAKGPKLRSLVDAGRGIFQTVLTPESNADHRDHFHMDIGR